MKALLLAAGIGSRLRPLTTTTPKCLVPIGQKPLLGYWIDNLIKAGVTDIYINLHYLASEVRKFVKMGDFQCNIHFLEENKLLGTGGTLKKNLTIFQEDSFLFAHADNFCLADLSAFISAHKNRPSHVKITMMTFISENPSTCGVVELDNENIVIEFHEKISCPPTNLASGAVFVIEPDVLPLIDNWNAECVDFSKDILPLFKGKMLAWHNSVYHRDIGNIKDYQKANLDWKKMQNKERRKSV